MAGHPDQSPGGVSEVGSPFPNLEVKNTFYQVTEKEHSGPPTCSAPPVLVEHSFRTRPHSDQATSALPGGPGGAAAAAGAGRGGPLLASGISDADTEDPGLTNVPGCGTASTDEEDSEAPAGAVPRVQPQPKAPSSTLLPLLLQQALASRRPQPPRLGSLGQLAEGLPPPPQSPVGDGPGPLQGLGSFPPPPQSPAAQAAFAFGPACNLPPPPQSPQGEGRPTPLLQEHVPALVATSSALPPPPQSPVSHLPGEIPSLGSAQHTSSNCTPCAWYWKPQGCLNGRNCSRCHLCPQGEVKARKKAAKTTVPQRQEPQAPNKKAGVQQLPDEPAYVSVPSVVSRIASELDRMSVDRGVMTDANWVVEVKNTFYNFRDTETPQVPSGPPTYSAPSILTWPERATREEPALAEEAASEAPAPDTPQGKTGPEPATHQNPTIQALHEKGECKPCSYFWYKADGCRNGETCEFCHLCEKGESKKRKKEKVKKLKQEGKFQAIGTAGAGA